MKLSVCIETLYLKLPVAERIRRVAEQGVRAVEFWDWRDKPLAELAELCRELAVQVRVFSGQRRGSLVNPDERDLYLQEIQEACRAAAILGCQHLMLTSNQLDQDGRVVNPAGHIPDALKSLYALQTLRCAASLARQAGVVLLLEALNTRIDHPGCDLWSYDVAAALVEAVASPHLKLLLDVYHRQVMEGYLIGFIRRWGRWVGHVHVADVPGRHEPGTGEIAWKEVIRALSESAPEACVGLECIPSGDSDTAIEAFCRLF